MPYIRPYTGYTRRAQTHSRRAQTQSSHWKPPVHLLTQSVFVVRSRGAPFDVLSFDALMSPSVLLRGCRVLISSKKATAVVQGVLSASLVSKTFTWTQALTTNDKLDPLWLESNPISNDNLGSESPRMFPMSNGKRRRSSSVCSHVLQSGKWRSAGTTSTECAWITFPSLKPYRCPSYSARDPIYWAPGRTLERAVLCDYKERKEKKRNKPLCDIPCHLSLYILSPLHSTPSPPQPPHLTAFRIPDVVRKTELFSAGSPYPGYS